MPEEIKPKIVEIARLGEPVLRMRAKEIANPKEVGQLIADMEATRRYHRGIGIAAPQVFVSQRVIIISSAPTPRFPDAPKVDPFHLINPCIIEESKDRCEGLEGCLSLPGLFAPVRRPYSVKVEYQDIQGIFVVTTLEGLLARVFMHEYDHLEGVMFIDRVNLKGLTYLDVHERLQKKNEEARTAA